MLSEIFFLRLEAALRAAHAAATGSSDSRFLAIKLPASPAPELKPAGKSN